MKLGTRGEALIKTFEGLRLTSFLDVSGLWTIGYGHTHGVRPGMTITEETAEQMLREDVMEAEETLKAFDLPQGCFDALVSLVFNVGPRAVSKRSTIGRALAAHSYIDAWAGFALWVKTPGAEHGLARRRSAEMALFAEDEWPSA